MLSFAKQPPNGWPNCRASAAESLFRNDQCAVPKADRVGAGFQADCAQVFHRDWFGQAVDNGAGARADDLARRQTPAPGQMPVHEIHRGEQLRLQRHVTFSQPGSALNAS